MGDLFDAHPTLAVLTLFSALGLFFFAIVRFSIWNSQRFLDFGPPEEPPPQKPFQLSNRGTVPLQVTAAALAPWIQVQPAQASIAPGSTAEFVVRVVRGLQPVEGAVGAVVLSGSDGSRKEIRLEARPRPE